jgi:HprK-related kinase A
VILSTLPGSTLLADTSPSRVAQALAGPGLWLDVGLVTLRLRSDEPALAAQIRSVYRYFPFADQAPWADLHLDLMRVKGVRRWLKPQVRVQNDGQVPFDPFPADSPLPLMEWSANWLIGRRCNDVLLLHSGVVERDGLAVVMPALPGSGKSTLTAALSLSGWRLLSDEFGAVNLETGAMHPVLKPAALKNQSIDVIRRFAPDAELGPLFPKTRKGTVAHVAPSREAVARVHTPAQPAAILLPRWQAGSATEFIPVDERMAFSTLAFNAFNYSVVGADGFRCVVTMVRQCPAWQLIYSDLGDALSRLDELWPSIVQGHAARVTLAAELAAQEPLA